MVDPEVYGPDSLLTGAYIPHCMPVELRERAAHSFPACAYGCRLPLSRMLRMGRHMYYLGLSRPWVSYRPFLTKVCGTSIFALRCRFSGGRC
jgi:hypothetical protein